MAAPARERDDSSSHEIHDAAEPRPRIRADCIDGPRPCPFYSCRHHLGLDVVGSRTVRLHVDPDELDEDTDTCALDVAARGEHTLQAVADVLGLTRERIRQLEARALDKLEAAGVSRALLPDPRRDGWP